MAVKSSSPASNSITERRASEEVRGASSVVKDETPASERKPSDGTEVAGGIPAESSTTPVESGTPTSVGEPGADDVFDGVVSLGKEAGLNVEPATSEIAGVVTMGSSSSSINAGATVSIAESKVNEASGGAAPLANARSEAIEPAGSKISSSIADSPGSAGLMVPKLQPPVPKAGQTPLAPATGLHIVSSN